MVFLNFIFDLRTKWTYKAADLSGIRKQFRSIKHSSLTNNRYIKLRQEVRFKALTLVNLLRIQLSTRTRQWFGYLDLKYKQITQFQIKKHEYAMKVTLILICENKNKIWVQLVLMRVTYNVFRLSIYIMNNYTTLFAVQAIFMVVTWASSYLTCISSCLKSVPCGSRHF
jgi:hypothetical protein